MRRYLWLLGLSLGLVVVAFSALAEASGSGPSSWSDWGLLGAAAGAAAYGWREVKDLYSQVLTLQTSRLEAAIAAQTEAIKGLADDLRRERDAG